MKPLKMSNYKIVAWLTFLIIIIKTNNIKANPEASSSTSVNDDHSMVELSFECRNLHSGDRLSRSDPFVVVFLQVHGQSAWYKIGNTESKKNNHNPTFTQVVVATHIFEEKQLLKFDVYDKDRSNMDDLKLHTFLGSAEESLGTLIRKRTTELTLINTKKSTSISSTNAGTIIIKTKEYGEDKGKVTLGLNGFNLDKKNSILGGGGSDPYIEIQKCNIESNNTENCVTVKKTESIKGNNTNPQWATFDIPVWLLCDGSYDRKLKFTCWDYNTTLKDSYIGEFNVTLNDLIKQFRTTSRATFQLINHKKQKKEKNYSISGVIHVRTFIIGPNITLIDFIQSGTDIHGVVSIDFTSSNGDIKNKSSNHHFKPEDKKYSNIYEQAIWSVVSVIEDYDTDKQIPVFGFGCFDGHKTSDLFNVNGREIPDCSGASGVLEAYKNCLATVELCGPTNFAPTIHHVIELAREVDKGKGYYILLIFTDGVVSDGPDTEKAIITASKLPISIIIVGVGGGNFSKMQKMAAHERLLVDASGQPVRDIVHFVKFVGNKNFNKNIGFSQLAKDVLAEIPQQFLGYMKLNNIIPSNKVTNKNFYVEH